MKLQIMCSDEMCERIDICAKELGVTRSAFCMMLIASGIPQWEKDLRVPTLNNDDAITLNKK